MEPLTEARHLRDTWGRKHQQPRSTAEWVTLEAPDLRIVPESLWMAAHARLEGAREDYERRTGGRAFGRPVNGTESPYLLTGLAQCGICGGGLFMQSRSHGRQRARFYACSTFHHRGRRICPNNQALPMSRIDREVLAAFREDLLNPAVLERALNKLRDRLAEQPTMASDRAAALQDEADRLRGELSRLSAALAQGAEFATVLEAIRDRERRQAAIRVELAALESESTQAIDRAGDVVPELRRRLAEWREILGEETSQARQMLRTLLQGRIVFTPRPEIEFTRSALSNSANPRTSQLGFPVFTFLHNVQPALASHFTRMLSAAGLAVADLAARPATGRAGRVRRRHRDRVRRSPRRLGRLKMRLEVERR